MKHFQFISLLAILLVFVSCKNEPKSMLDPEHKTFCVNGISAIDGHEAVLKSLSDLGFKLKEGKVYECDLTEVGMGFTYYANYIAKGLSKDQASKLTCGLFDNLPSGVSFENLPTDDCRIYLSWYKSGEIKHCLITFSEFCPLADNKDVAEVNKRLAAMFPHSKIGNSSLGTKIYYDDNGVEVSTGDTFTLELEKRDGNSL